MAQSPIAETVGREFVGGVGVAELVRVIAQYLFSQFGFGAGLSADYPLTNDDDCAALGRYTYIHPNLNGNGHTADRDAHTTAADGYINPHPNDDSDADDNFNAHRDAGAC